MMDTNSIAARIHFEMGLLNSLRPLLRKYVWITKAKIPPKQRMNEKMRPDAECLETRINP
jgi:hypothetical protein